MGSFTDLNTYSNQTLSFTDLRLPNVIFSSPDVSDITSIISTNVFDVQLSTNILEIIRPVLADVKYIIDVTAVAGTTVNFGTLPAGISVVESPSGVYTVNGIDSISDWDAVKTPTITVPGTFSGSFFYDVTIRYNNVNGQQNLTYQVGKFIPVSVIQSSFGFNLTTSNVLRNEALLPGVFVSVTTPNRIKQFESDLTSTTSITTTLSKFVGFAALNFGAFTQQTLPNATVASGVKNKTLESAFSRFFSVNYISYFEPTEFASTAAVTKALTGFRQFGEAGFNSEFTTPAIDNTRLRLYDVDISAVASIPNAELFRATRDPGPINLTAFNTEVTLGTRIKPLSATLTSSFTVPSIDLVKIKNTGPATYTMTSSITKAEANMPLVFEVNMDSSNTRTVAIDYIPIGSTVEIDWGDGNQETYVAPDGLSSTPVPKVSHTYAATATPSRTVTAFFYYTYRSYQPGLVEWWDESPRIVNEDVATGVIAGVISYGDVKTRTDNFYARPAQVIDNGANYYVPDHIDLGFLSTESLFEDDAHFNDSNVASWDTSNVEYMNETFKNASSFDQNISTWDTSNVLRMESMFQGATTFNQNLNSWDVSNVSSMDFMFQGADAYNQPMNLWSCDSLTSAQGFLSGAISWNNAIWTYAPNLNTITGFFNGTQNVSNASIANFPVDNGNITSLQSIFSNTTGFTADVTGWDTSNITNLTSLTSNSDFNQNISTWNTSSVENMNSAFFNNETFNQPIGSWDVSNVFYFNSTFNQARSFNQPLNTWNTSSAFEFNSMFRSAEIFNQPLNNWDVTGSTSGFTTPPFDFEEMFTNAYRYDQNISSWCVEDTASQPFGWSSTDYYSWTVVEIGTNWTTSGSGTGAQFSVERNNGVYTVTLLGGTTGSGFAPTDTITVDGYFLHGVSGTNDLTITVDNVDAQGRITAFSTSGVAKNWTAAEQPQWGAPC